MLIAFIDEQADAAAVLGRQLELPVLSLFELQSRPASEVPEVILVLDRTGLELRQTGKPGQGGVKVDFTDPALLYRLRRGGGRKEPLARAVGLKKNRNPHIFDLTAGLGRDSFVLAALGCRITMFERSPVIAALLADGLQKAAASPACQEISRRMGLVRGDAASLLAEQCCTVRPQVIYLDPMFPHSSKSAHVKKEMQVLRLVAGPDLDSDRLFEAALQHAEERVVVKRPAYAEFLGGRQPNMSIKTKKHRFDVYLTITQNR